MQADIYKKGETVLRNLKLFLCLSLTMVILIGLVGVIGAQGAEAQGHSLAELLKNGQIKPLGRTTVNDDATGIRTDWSGSGFAMNVTADGGIFTVNYTSSYASYWVILADGEQVWRGIAPAATSGKTFTAVIPKGSYTLSVVKETQIGNSSAAYFDLNSVTFAGTVNARPADKPLYIEFVGDSYSCGDGALGTYNAGAVWTAIDDSATNGFPYFTAQLLGADYSIVARGGIGLAGDNAQEPTTSKINMQQIYNFASGYRDMNTGKQYDFSVHPADIVVVHLGANDDTSTAARSGWKTNLSYFITQVRDKNPNAAIVFASHKPACYYAMKQIIAEREATDPNLYAFLYSHQGNGSAALATQKEGHPSAEDHKAIAEALASFLRKEGLTGNPQQTEAKYQDIEYYVSANGSNNSSGKTPQTAKLTVAAAISQAIADNTATLPNGSRLVFYVDGEVVFGSSQALGGSTTIKTADGSDAPILIATRDFDGANRALLRITYKPSNAGSSSVYVQNSFTFQNVTLRSESNDANTFCAAYLYAAGHAITFDNAILTTDGKAASYSSWNVYADHFVPTGLNLNAARIDSSVTFRNGDYTNLNMVAAVASTSLYRVQSAGGSITSLPNMHCRITIEDGAKMGAVYGAYGTLQVGSVTVEVKGGVVGGYRGTGSGSSTTRKNYTIGSLNTIVSGGKITNVFYGTGNYVNFTGNINNTFSGGDLWLEVNSNTIAMTLACGSYATINGNVTNTVSGGNLITVGKTATAACGIYFGGNGNFQINGDLINNISAGNIAIIGDEVTPAYTGIHLAGSVGNISGQLRNTITGGVFDLTASVRGGAYYLSGQGLDTNIAGGIVNIIGVKGRPDRGPRFVGSSVFLAGGLGRIGANGNMSTMPSDSYYDPKASISNTIYGGAFGGGVYCSVYSTSSDISGSHVAFVGGNVTNNIYGGKFMNDLYCGGGGAKIYGSVTTNIYGGTFCSIYGGSSVGNINGNVTLNITAMKEYYSVFAASAAANLGIYGGSGSGRIGGNVTLNITPASYEDVSLRTALHSGSKTGAVSGSKTISITAGTFPGGLSVDGLPLANMLASGSVVCGSNGYKVTLASGQTSQSGLTTVRPGKDAAVSVFHCLCGMRKTESDPTDACLDGCTHEILEWKAWESRTSLPITIANQGNWYLVNNVTTSSQGSFAADKNTPKTLYRLDLNGKSVNYKVSESATDGFRALATFGRYDASDSQASTYRADLVITDASAGRDGRIMITLPKNAAPNGNTANILWVRQGNVDIFGGILDGTNANTTNIGAAVNIEAGNTLNLYGGTIIGGTTTNRGATVNAGTGATLHMYGGKIIGGTAANGGAVAIAGGTFTMDGGEIFGGSATASGGAVAVTAGTVTLNSGDITGGTAKNGGAVAVTGGTFTMHSGKITDGSSTGNGGNIYVSNSGKLIVNGGVISDGRTQDSGGNLAVYSTVTFNGGTVEGGVAEKNKNTGNFFHVGGTVTLADSTVEGSYNISPANVGKSNEPAVILSGSVKISGEDGGLATFSGAKITAEALAENAQIHVTMSNADELDGQVFAAKGNGFAADMLERICYAAMPALHPVLEGDNLVWRSPVAQIGGKLYSSISEALTDYTADGDPVRLVADITDDVALEKEIILDLNGFDVNGRIFSATAGVQALDTANGHTLHVIDSTTDTQGDGTEVGRIKGDVSVKIAAATQTNGATYVHVVEKDGVKETHSFHKIELVVTYVNLRPMTARNEPGLYFTSTIKADEMALDHYGDWLKFYGSAYIKNEDTGTKLDDYAYSSFSGERPGDKVFGTLIDGMLRTGANTPLCSKTYIMTVDDEEFFGQSISLTLKDVIKAADSMWEDLKAEQKDAMRAMYNAYYAEYMADWDLAHAND